MQRFRWYATRVVSGVETGAGAAITAGLEASGVGRALESVSTSESTGGNAGGAGGNSRGVEEDDRRNEDERQYSASVHLHLED